MAEDKLLTVRDVSLILGVSEKEVMDLAEKGIMPAYKIGGVYLRFKLQQVEEFRKTLKAQQRPFGSPSKLKATFKDKISDFFYFNDFYILSILLILLILIIIFRK